MQVLKLIIFLNLIALLGTSCGNTAKKTKHKILQVPANTFDFNKSHSFYSHLVGHIGDLSSEMNLIYIESSNSFIVNYLDTKNQVPVHLTGTIVNNRLVLKSLDPLSNKTSELFYGSYQSDHLYVGQWYNKDSSEVLDFEFKEYYDNQSIRFTLKSFDTIYDCSNELGQLYTARLKYNYLVSDDASLNNAIKSQLPEATLSLKQTLEYENLAREDAKNQFFIFKNQINEISQLDDTSYQYDLSFDFGRSPEVVRNDSSYLIFTVASMTNYGGLHSSTENKVICINQKTKRTTLLQSIIDTYGKDNLLLAINKKIRSDNNLNEEQNFTESVDAMFLIDQVQDIPENFYITKNALVFLFNETELKAAAAGAQFVVVPINTIQN